jgi:lipopolysaccharide export system protein LptA
MAIFGAIAIPNRLQMATAQTSGGGGGPLTIRSDVQEYDAKTQVGIARGRVQMDYPERGIKATAAQAQFFNRERRIVLSGNVFIYQQGGNSIQGETVTYLIDEGRFIAQPRDQSTQVQSVYIVRDTQIAPAPGKAPATPSSRR